MTNGECNVIPVAMIVNEYVAHFSCVGIVWIKRNGLARHRIAGRGPSAFFLVLLSPLLRTHREYAAEVVAGFQECAALAYIYYR